MHAALTALLTLVLHFFPGLPDVVGQGQEEAEAAAQEEPAAGEEIVVPDTVEGALEMRIESEELEQRPLAELEPLLAAWLTFARQRSGELDTALDAPQGTPEHDASATLRTDLDTLLSEADKILEVMVQGGADVDRARATLASLRRDDEDLLETSTVPANRHKALELPVEVLKAQLRPLTREQVSEQLGQWMKFLQRTCLEVRNVEVSAIQSEDSAAVETYNARAVVLRGERARLIKRVDVVVDALEDKGGDVEEARAYVSSIVVAPPITGWRAAWTTARTWLTDRDGGIAMGKQAGVALLILAAFWLLAKVLGRVASRAARSIPRASGLLREFITSLVRRLTILIGILIALSTLGINMTPLVAAIGAAGLVIGLALQGTLSNLASGLLIMVYRPFDVGDVVKTSGASGKVDGMTLMTTAIKTFDNQTIHVPNNMIWGDVITNVTANKSRRVDMIFGISYDDDTSKAKEILTEIVTGHEKVLADPPPVVRVHELGESSVNLVVRPWAATADYWDVYWDVTEAVKRAFDAKGISIPYPQRDVHLIPVPGTGGGDGGELIPARPRPQEERTAGKA